MSETRKNIRNGKTFWWKTTSLLSVVTDSVPLLCLSTGICIGILCESIVVGGAKHNDGLIVDWILSILSLHLLHIVNVSLVNVIGFNTQFA